MIIVQMSDTHISTPGTAFDVRWRTASRLEKAVDHIEGLAFKPDLVLVSGDCVESGALEEYERLQAILGRLAVPVFPLMGNHDDRANLRRAFSTHPWLPKSGFLQFSIEDWPLRVLALDTQIEGSPCGRLCQERLHWLNESLAKEPGRPTLIALYHPPFLTGMPLLDAMGLEGSAEFGALLDNFHAIELITSGHVHRAMQRRFHGTIAMTCPSTSHQAELDFGRPERLAVGEDAPGCLVHHWSEEKGVVTHFSPIRN